MLTYVSIEETHAFGCLLLYIVAGSIESTCLDQDETMVGGQFYPTLLGQKISWLNH